MDAGPHRRRFAFLLDVVAAISDEGPGMAISHHVGSQLAAIGAAKRQCGRSDRESGFAGNVAVADEGAQVFGGSPSGGPSVSARLGRLGRVDPPIVDRSRLYFGSSTSFIPGRLIGTSAGAAIARPAILHLLPHNRKI